MLRPAYAGAMNAEALAMQAQEAAPATTFEDSLLDIRKRVLSQRLVMHMRVLYENTLRNIGRGDYLSIKNDFNALLEDPGVEAQKRMEVIGQRGLMEVALGDLDAAGPDIDIGIRALDGKELSAGHKVLLSNLRMLKGHILFKSGRVEQALEEEDKAVALDPKYGMPNVFRGRFLLKLGRYEEASLAYEKAVSLDPAIKNKKNVCKEFKAAGQTPPSCGTID